MFPYTGRWVLAVGEAYKYPQTITMRVLKTQHIPSNFQNHLFRIKTTSLRFFIAISFVMEGLVRERTKRSKRRKFDNKMAGFNGKYAEKSEFSKSDIETLCNDLMIATGEKWRVEWKSGTFSLYRVRAVRGQATNDGPHDEGPPDDEPIIMSVNASRRRRLLNQAQHQNRLEHVHEHQAGGEHVHGRQVVGEPVHGQQTGMEKHNNAGKSDGRQEGQTLINQNAHSESGWLHSQATTGEASKNSAEGAEGAGQPEQIRSQLVIGESSGQQKERSDAEANAQQDRQLNGADSTNTCGLLGARRCKYTILGCKEAVFGTNLTVHEAVCSYGLCVCPCSVSLSTCSFGVGRTSNLVEHLKTVHNAEVELRHEFTRTYELSGSLLADDSTSVPTVIEVNGSLFYLHFESSNGSHKACIVSVDEKTAAKQQYYYQLQVTGPTEEIIWNALIRNVREYNNLRASDNLLIIPHKLAIALAGAQPGCERFNLMFKGCIREGNLSSSA